MSGKSKGNWTKDIETAVAAVIVSFFLSLEGLAAGNVASPVATSANAAMSSDAADKNNWVSSAEEAGGEASDVVVDEDIIEILSVELPVVAEGDPSPFDFILDPCGLIYETDAIRYGGRSSGRRGNDALL